MIIKGEEGSLELARSEPGFVVPSESAGILFNVSVHAYGYSAADQALINRQDFEHFMSAMQELECKREGCAVLRSAVPEDLYVEIHSTGDFKYLGARGHIGWINPTGDTLHLRFSFDFAADLLPQVLLDLRGLAATPSASPEI